MIEDQNIPPEQLPDVQEEKEEGNVSQAETIEQSSIENTETQTENMEVHAHPHNVMHKKNWKEYVLEFFMIFFAVTLGFFAEGYREYVNDRHKENEYMQALLKDVRNDSVILRATVKEVTDQDNWLDSLVFVLRQPLSDRKNLERAYVMYLKYGEEYSHVFFSEGSISQMINSGGLRIVRNSNMVKLINEYQNIKLLVRKDEDDMRRLEGEIERGQANHIFDFTSSSKLDRFMDTATAKVPVDSLMQLAGEATINLISNDPVFIASFRNNLKSYQAFNEDYLYWIQGTIVINNKMIAGIKREYGEGH